jgi:hypothetical protein
MRDSAIADGGAQDVPNREEIWKRSGNTQSHHATVDGADRKCGKKCVVESLAAFGLAVHFPFFLAVSWQGCAGSSEALQLGEGGQKWRRAQVLFSN